MDELTNKEESIKEPTKDPTKEPTQKTKQKDKPENQNQPVRGCYDYDPETLRKLTFIQDTIRQVSRQMGITEIETPTMEYTSLLLNKYGEEAETKLIYKMKGEETALRYDLTVPFVRFVTNSGLESIKKLQIGRVYRRDCPYPSRGRFCEFLQGDIDIVGDREPMVAETELLKLVSMVLTKLNITGYVIRINYRQNLQAIFQQIGVDVDNIPLFKSLSSAIDKMDKHTWTEITTELHQKGLTPDQTTKLKELLDGNYIDPTIMDEYKLLSQYLAILDVPNVKFDATLARGLDYYTGLIYEVIVPGSEMGSIIAGGRYNKLIQKTFKKGKVYLPAIGVSFGISRLSVLIPPLQPKIEFKIYLVSERKYLEKKLEIYRVLLEAGYQVEYLDRSRRNLKEIQFGIKNDFNFVLVYGENDDYVCVKKNDKSNNKLSTISKLVEVIQNFDDIKGLVIE